MKTKTIFALILALCALVLVCGCGTGGTITESDRAAKLLASFSGNDMNAERPVWEGLLYAALKLGTTDTENSGFRSLALCYTVTHYGFGALTDKHSDTVNADASASRTELEMLARAMFGQDAVLSDDDLSGCFEASGETYAAKDGISFDAAEYSEELVLAISGKKATGYIKTGDDDYVSLTFTFEKNGDTESPYVVCISAIAAAG